MKNRLICLALCLVMLASVVLTGCSSKTSEEVQSEINETQSESARSLTMWLVSEKEIDAETATRVTNAVNEITESKFKVRMTLYFFTESEYEAVLTENIRLREDSKSIFTTGTNTEVETEATTDETATILEETETDKFGRVTVKYPDLKPNQVDIVYIQGEEMFKQYVSNGWLKQLDEELSASSKKIKEFVSQTLLTAAKINGGTYAIPNNSTIGEYTFMLIDKEIASKFGTDGAYERGDIDGFFNEYIYSYLDNVRALNDSSIVPVDGTYDELLSLLAHYWSIDPDTYETDNSRFSVLGYRYTNPSTLSRGTTILSFDSLLGDSTFCKNYYELNRMKMLGNYYGEATEGKTPAVKFATGDLSDYNAYLAEDSEYLPVIVKYPSVDVDDVYENMFGVCAYAEDLSACMEILTYLTTNTDFRNLIQYGVEGEDYKVVKDDDGNSVVERLQDNYLMDVFKTGNTFIAYPDPSKGLTADVWEIGKQQNRQALVEPLLNFDFAELAKTSGTSSSSSRKVGSTGYTYTFTTGYSREVLAQNALLKAWIDSADANGKGVYVLHTCPSNSGQNLSAMVYYYNNNIKDAKVDVTDGDGAVNVAYTGTAGDGYEITIIDFYGKKNSSKLNWNYTFNGTTSPAIIKYQNSLLTFDALNTETYNITVTSDLTLAMIAENSVAVKWAMSKSGSKGYVGTYVADNSEGGKTYTYIVYVPKITLPYSLKTLPSGTDKVLNLNVDYVINETGKLGSTEYALFLVTVRADADVTVNFNLNGLETADPETFTEDPKLTVFGALDTEMVKYFDMISTKVANLVNAVVTKTGATEKELKAVIDDLNVLFTVPENVEFVDSDLQTELASKLSTDDVKAFVAELNLADFYWYLVGGTSKAEVHHKEAEVGDEGPTGKYIDKTENTLTGESYYYYQSPYAIYYAWLKSNGYAK